MTKEEIRIKYKEIRNKVLNKENKSNAIVNKILELKEYKNAKVIAVFKSLKNEVNTDMLIKYALKQKKIVLLPKVDNDNLEFYKIVSLKENLIKSEFGVLEPNPNISKLYEPEKIDLIIVPGLAFDTENNRIGHGKGCYDRFLKNKKFNKVGICFKNQYLEKEILPIDNHDIKVDMVITE